MISLDSGLVDENDSVNCDRTEEIGASIQCKLDGVSFANSSFKRKDKVTTLQCLYSSVTSDEEIVTIDPLTLFLRLVVAIDRRPENEIEDYIYYELSPYPMSLFKSGIMRSASKAQLKALLLKGTLPYEPLPDTFTSIGDGGVFLWCCNWKKNELFGDIFKKYVNAANHFKIDVAVFDGYAVSTKDSTRQKRTGKMLQSVEISDDNPCPSDRDLFLANYTNKQKFVSALAEKLNFSGVIVILCPSDADTTIVKTALEIERPVLDLTDDTDNLCLMMHHVHVSVKSHEMYIKKHDQKENQ